ncbi:MAG TPA: DNA-formamidopyrimidine glycosylase family protein [Chthoniobacterales bacterium]|jgi:formamidopyrimidine-DNA glycosylase|nr:DNA-formamidopyrimidine glycosylase family protein [Chthoniobacterales bacterium]
MPELAEVEWFRKQWDAGRGAEIVDLSLHARNRIFRGEDLKDLRQRLISTKLLGSQARGKRMVFKFSGDNWLGIHLGMTGKIRVESANYRPGKHDHLVLFQRECALVFTDSRQFGRIRFHHGTDEPNWWKGDAPEIISREFDQKFLDQFLDRHRKAPIKAVLLMQNGFPGIGNWMADEILWRAKALPSKRTGKLSARERAELFRATKFVVRRSLETLGQDFSDPPCNWLIHQKWKRDGICPIHRTLLRHAMIGGRTTAWCPKCQT